MRKEVFFSKIIIIGLGLIGGSIAKSCKRFAISSTIYAIDNDGEQLEYALKSKIIDKVYDFNQKLTDSDLLIVATPLNSYREIIQKISPNLSKNTIISDVGSLKSFIEEELIQILGKKDQNFVACHPIAGSEKIGVENSSSELFMNKKLIITPFLVSNEKKVNKVAEFWQAIGSQVEFMDSKDHDKIYALVSHLPQMISFNNKNNLKKFTLTTQVIDRHLRLENSGQKIWDDVFGLNRDNLDYYFQEYLDNLQLLRLSLENKQFDSIILFLEKASKIAEDFNPSIEIDLEMDKGNQNLLLTRIIIVSCYLNLPDIREFKSYSAAGFRDFIAILSYAKSLLKEDNLFDILKDVKL